jgi:K+-transporting ATPase ATPase C chain
MSPSSPSRVPPPPPVHSPLGHLRAAGVFLVLALLLAGVIYPLVVTGIAQVINPSGANGSLLYYPNGTLAGSKLVAQNTDEPYLFWERPSATDYNTTNGTVTPPGPSDPMLAAWLNETLSYMRLYGNYTVNASLPFWFAAPSASDIDPDLTPEAVLVQVPRVSEHTNLSLGELTGLVNAHITEPVFPMIGVPYVNVLELDLALLPMIGR